MAARGLSSTPHRACAATFWSCWTVCRADMACLHCALVVKVLGAVSLDKPRDPTQQSVTLCLLAHVLCLNKWQSPSVLKPNRSACGPCLFHQIHQGSGSGSDVPTGSPSRDTKSWHALICRDLLPKHGPSACWHPVGPQSCMSLLYTNTQQFPVVPKSVRPWRPSSTLDIPPLSMDF